MLEQWILWAPRVGASLIVLAGMAGVFNPKILTGNIGIELTTPMAMSEARSIYGGIFLGIGTSALFLDSALAYACLGCGLVCVVPVRIYSIFVDGASPKLSMVPIVIDLTCASLLLARVGTIA